MNGWLRGLSLSSLLHAYARLAPRERLLVQIAVAVTAFLAVYGMVATLESKKSDLRARIVAKEHQLEEVQKLRMTYLELRREADVLISAQGSQPENFSLFSFLDGVGTKTLTREKILAMSPSSKTVGDQYVEEQVEMRLSAVSLSQMVNLLHEIENAPAALRVARLQMKKRYNDSYNFDVTLVVSSLKSA